MVVNIFDFLGHPSKDPEQLLQEWNEKAKPILEAFACEDLHKQKADNPTGFIDYIKDVLLASALFMDDAMKQKLEDVGVSPFVLDWIIPLRKILHELDKLESSGAATLSRAEVLPLIKAHIDGNWLSDLQITFGYSDTVNKKPNSPLIKSRLHRLYRNRNQQTGSFSAKDDTDRTLIEMIMAMEAVIHIPGFVEKHLKQLASGNTKKSLLKSIVDSDETHPRTNRFYRSFYSLFALLNPNIYFPTKEEYNTQFGWLSLTYVQYQAKVIKNLIR